jgi:hypothetical protein
MDQAYNETFEREIEAPVARPVKEAFSDFFLPYSAPAARSGELGLGDVAKDAAGYVAGGVIGRGVTKGLQGAAPMFEEAARRVPRNVPIALAEFLQFPKTGYDKNLVSRATGQSNVKLFDDFFGQTDEIIPRGTELYRAPTASQVTPSRYSQSVPMPRDVGAEFLPGRVQSFGNSADLNRLGALMRGLGEDTGGAQWRNPGMVSITTMDDIPGIKDLPQFLSRYADDIPENLPIESNFVGEGLLGPATQYILRDFNPGNIPASLRGADGRLTQPLGQADYQVPTWIFEAFRGN